MAELFAYRDVLNGIVLARSTQEVVFTGYMTYRACGPRTSNEPFLSNEKHLEAAAQVQPIATRLA